MKRMVILFLLGVCLPVHLMASKRKGYFINNSGDTSYVVFRIPAGLFSKVPNYEKLQWGITFFDTCNQTHILLPDQANEYCFPFKSLTVRMVSVNNTMQPSGTRLGKHTNLFLHLINDGKLRLFRFYDYNGYLGNTPDSPDPVLQTAPGSVEVYLFQKGDGEIFIPGREHYCESLRSYFSGCPQVIEMLEGSGCRGVDPVRLSETYNTFCSK